ncbi:ATP-grasp domain-containing protein [Paenibacillus medicaginis]|uniref:ATP-grasp domain-containing protein n=1 Tax=Paenibacillus medicaginis TaxID=1470560 RepID=A0ABV5BVP4_9BACL
MKHILFVESREYLPGIEFCKQQNWKVTLLTTTPEFYQKEKLAMVDDVFTVETYDEQKVVEFVRQYHARQHLDAVLSFSDLYVIPATAAAKAIGVPTMDPEATKRARNKWITRELCKQHGIPSPSFYNAANLQQALEAAEKIGYPCIIKPVDGASSLGVKCVHNPQELERAYADYMENRHLGKGLYGSERLLIEQYIEGELFSVETLTCNGATHVLGITDRQLIGFPGFIESAGVFPIVGQHQDSSIQLVLRCLQVLGIDFGAAHTEIVLTAKGPLIIEVNPRMGGGPVHDLIYYATGIDFVKEIIKIHMGKPPELQPVHSKVAAAKILYSTVNGTLRSIKQHQPILEQMDVKHFKVSKIGQQVKVPESNFDSIGTLVVVGDTESAARSRLELIEQQLEFIVE